MKLKKLSLFLIFISLLGLFTSCEEESRANRPFRSISGQTSIQDDNQNDEENVETIERPTGVVFLQAGSCACQNGEPTIIGNCASLCASKPQNSKEILYMSVKLSEVIELSDYKDLNGWCTLVLTDEGGEALPGQENPGCVLEARDDDNNLRASIPLVPASNSKNFSVEITNVLSSDTNYRLTLKEATSGAKSNTVQIYKYDKSNVQTIPGPLWINPVTQYTCFSRVTTQDDGSGALYFDDAFRLHFYFIEKNRPDPIPQTFGNLFCHDIFTYGTKDREIYPRLEETPNAISLWNAEDPRFYDLTGGDAGASNGIIDVYDIIYEELNNQNASTSGELKIFYPFNWPGAPELDAEAGNPNAGAPLGYYMAPWIDKTTLKSYCPTVQHYGGSNPLFRAMKDIIGIGTEGLYIAKREKQTIFDNGEYQQAPEDYILMRESKLKKIWFYIENGIAKAPTEENVKDKKIQFYYPADEASPFVRKSHQSIYTVKSAQELQTSSNPPSGSGSDGSGAQSTYPPHDRKIGCIPKLN